MLTKHMFKYLIYVFAAVLSTGCILMGKYFHTEHLVSQAVLAEYWLKICYPLLIIFSFSVSLIFPVSPWLLAFVLAATTYVFTTSLFGAQAPPFEVILMILLAFPYILSSYLGLLAGRIFRKNKNVRTS